MEEELKCPQCGSSQTSYRVKTKDRICYKCGYVYFSNNIIKEVKN